MGRCANGADRRFEPVGAPIRPPRLNGYRIAASLVLLLITATQPATAQFGRNKLQHQVFDFQILRTAHFEIYYYPREREAALDAARMAERSYARLSRILGHEFEERKPIILYASHSEFQQTNALPGFIAEGTGGVTEFAKRRVILPFTGTYAEFERVLTHELVHAFQFDLVALSLASQLSAYEFNPPLWFVEGMAEYLSIGDLDTHTHAWLRDATLSGYLRTVPEMSLFDDYLSYRFGQSFFAFVGAKYGDETIGLILQRSLRFGLDDAFEITLGITVQQLSDEWMEAVRTAYLPEAARFSTPEGRATRLTDHSFRRRGGEFASYLSPALSPDGTQVVYLSDRGNSLYRSFDLWLASAVDGAITERLISAARSPNFESLRFMTSSAAWAPDGRHVAFVAKVGGRDALYLYDVTKRKTVRRITVELDGIQNPTFSPDGMRIAFTGIRGGISDLYVVDTDGRRTQQLTADRYADLHPSWSPDGRHIALTTDRGPKTDFDELTFGNFRIALYRIGSGEIELLPIQDEGKNINPVWSPDGRALAFISDRTGINNIFIWSLDEGRLYQATDLLGAVTGIIPLSPGISWATRSDRLAFTYFEGAGYNVYVIDDPRAQARPVGETRTVPLVATLPLDAADRSASFFEGSLGDASGIGKEYVAVRDVGGSGSDHETYRRGGSNSGGQWSGPAIQSLSSASQSFYKTTKGFRPSAAAPEAEETGADHELTVASLMADAHMGLPDTSSFERTDYDVKLSPDIVGRPVIGAQVGGHFGSGVFGGSYILLSDILGDHNVFLMGQIMGSFDDAYILTEYAYLRERANLSMAYQQFPIYRFAGTIPNPGGFFFEDRFVRDVYRTLTTRVHYPLNTFQRLELAATGIYMSRDSVIDRVVVGRAAGGTDRNTKRLENYVFAGPSVAMVWDNALFGYTGPIAGRRLRIEVGRFFGDIAVSNITIDLRNYWNLGGQFSLATRLTSYSRLGPDENEFRVYWGGPYFIRGYDGNSFSLAECAESAKAVRTLAPSLCPVRDQLIGSSVAFASAEFRFPIVNFLDFGFVPLGLPPIHGVVFFDVGAAFNTLDQLVWSRNPGLNPSRIREPLKTVGVGLRINAIYSVFRVDYAYPLDRPYRHGGGIWSISFGPTF